MTQSAPYQQKESDILTTSSLTAAIRKGQLEVVDQAIKLSKEGKFDLNDSRGHFVSEAINTDQKEIAINLIGAGANLSGSAVKAALTKGWKEVVDQAINLSKEGKFDLNDPWVNLISEAINNNQKEIVITLVDAGAKVEFKHLVRSVKEGNDELFRFLTKEYPGLLKLTDVGENTVIHALAFSKSDISIIPEEIRSNYINSKNSMGDTVLHLSVCKDYYQISSSLSRFYKIYEPSSSLEDSKNLALMPRQDYIENDIKGKGQAYKVTVFTKKTDAESFFAKHGYAILKKEDSYSVIVALKSEETNKKTGSYSFSSASSSVDYDITEEASSYEAINSLLRAGANPNELNNLGLTARDIVESFCPSFLPTYDELINRQSINHTEL